MQVDTFLSYFNANAITASCAFLAWPSRLNNKGKLVLPATGQPFNQESPSVTPQKVTRSILW